MDNDINADGVKLERAKYVTSDGKFDKNAYMRDYMRMRAQKKKDAGNAQEAKDVSAKTDNSNTFIVKREPKKPDSDSAANNVKKKKRRNLEDIPPEMFADFSVSVENTTLAMSRHKDKKLKESEEQYIRNASIQLAKLYGVPQLLIPANYGFAMLIPHISRYVDVKIQREQIEIKKIQLEIKDKYGIDVSYDELSRMDESHRKSYVDTIQKNSTLKNLKQKTGIKISETDNGDVIIDS